MSDMKAFVGVTDKAWADILAQRSHLDEINFWLPSGRTFESLPPGGSRMLPHPFPHIKGKTTPPPTGFGTQLTVIDALHSTTREALLL